MFTKMFFSYFKMFKYIIGLTYGEFESISPRVYSQNKNKYKAREKFGLNRQCLLTPTTKIK